MHDMKALQRALDYAALGLRHATRPKKWTKALERRRAMRYRLQSEGTGTLVYREEGLPLNIAPDFPIIAVNLSRTGVAFLANYEFKTGDIIELTLPSPGEKPKRLKAKVVRSRRAGLRAHEVGAEFLPAE